MGSGYRGYFGNTYGFKQLHQKQVTKTVRNTSSIYLNAINTSKLFDFNNGLFGIKNRKKGRRPREIIVKNAQTSAFIFFNTLSKGGKKKSFKTSHGFGIEAILDDGTIVTYRPKTASFGSPAVEIRSSSSNYVKNNKYHIVSKVG